MKDTLTCLGIFYDLLNIYFFATFYEKDYQNTSQILESQQDYFDERSVESVVSV